jgi:histone H4
MAGSGSSAGSPKRSSGAAAYGKGKGGSKRHKKVHPDAAKALCPPAIRRLARRAGVKRLAGGVYEEARGLTRTFLESVVYYSLLYKLSYKRKTIGLKDVVFALKRRGNALIGVEQYAAGKSAKSGDKKKKADKKSE